MLFGRIGISNRKVPYVLTGDVRVFSAAACNGLPVVNSMIQCSEQIFRYELTGPGLDSDNCLIDCCRYPEKSSPTNLLKPAVHCNKYSPDRVNS